MSLNKEWSNPADANVGLVRIYSAVQVIYFSASLAPPPVHWVTHYLSHQESKESQKFQRQRDEIL